MRLVDPPRPPTLRQVRIDAGLERIVPEADFNKTPLPEVLAVLSRQTGTNIVCNFKGLEEAGIDPQAPVTLRLRGLSLENVLRAVERKIEEEGAGIGTLGICVNRESILMSTQEWITWHPQPVLCTYDVRDLIGSDPPPPLIYTHIDFDGAGVIAPPDPNTQVPGQNKNADQLIQLITRMIDSLSWQENGGLAGRIAELNGHLIVVQTRENQQKVALFLDQLRKGIVH